MARTTTPGFVRGCRGCKLRSLCCAASALLPELSLLSPLFSLFLSLPHSSPLPPRPRTAAVALSGGSFFFVWHQELKKQGSGHRPLKGITNNKSNSESWLGGRFWTAIRISDGMLQSACQDMISETLKGRLQKYFDLLHLGLSKHLLFKIFQINDSKCRLLQRLMFGVSLPFINVQQKRVSCGILVMFVIAVVGLSWDSSAEDVRG